MKGTFATARKPEKVEQESENALTHLEKKAARWGGFCIMSQTPAWIEPAIIVIVLKAIIPKSP